MSKLEELIQQLCPDGVEYKTIGEIAVDIFRGSGIKREQVTETGTPCVRYGEIYTTYGVWFDTCVSHTDESKITSKKYFEYGDILFAITGESVEDIAKCSAYIGQERCLAGGDIAVLRHNQDPKYLSYALSTTEAQKQKSKGKVKSKVVHASVPAIKELVVPIPPLEIQREIVRILDQFTKLTAELIAELIAELTARKKQYQYYSISLINHEKDVKQIPIRSLGTWCGGCTPSMANQKFWENGNIPWVSSKDMKNPVLNDTQDHLTAAALAQSPIKLLPKNTVAIVARSGILKHTLPVVFIPFETTVNQDIKALIVSQDVEPRYAYHVIRANSNDILLKTKKQGGTVDSLDIQKFMNYLVPLPPLEEQHRIVSILDRFDALCNDLTRGLPAEIEARRKQYEYYRDKLLTFRERQMRCFYGK